MQFGRAAFLVLCFLVPAELRVLGLDANGVRKIQDRFMAPCCWSQSVAVHDSPVARQMRQEIVSLASEGKTEEEIVDYYVGRYGDRILRQPRGRAWIWLNAVPFGALSAGLAGVLVFMARARKVEQ
jgi:cytochrome c-type biogenesis protein CcmH